MNDFNCGIKAYKSEVIKNISLTDGMHRYIPVLAKNAGFIKISEKEVKHHPESLVKQNMALTDLLKDF